ncbi:MAG: tyrosine-type recombinase/integrase [Sphingomonadaceae bacterium]
MPSGKITKRSIDALHPGEKDVYLWDAGGDEQVKGFGLKVTPGGAKTFIFQYRMGGRETKTQRWTIGKYGTWTADAARKEAKRLSMLVDQDINPIEDKRRREREAATLGFTDYIETFTDGYLKTDWGTSWPLAKRQLEMHVVPHLKDTPLPAIKVADLNPIFDALRSSPGVRRGVWAVLNKMLNWAEKRGDIDRNPMSGMDAPKHVPRRKRVLSPDELYACWHASYELDDPRGVLVRLLMITLQRRSEVAALPWAELNQAQRQWLLPGERSKNNQDHVIPLADLAMAEFESLGWKRRGLVLPCSTGKTPVSSFSDMKAALDKAMLPILQKRADERADALGEDRHPIELVPWRLHDLRRTGTTNLQALGFPIEVGERVINHHEGGEASGIRAVYNLYDYLPEKTRALDSWAEHLARLVTGSVENSNVVSIVVAR